MRGMLKSKSAGTQIMIAIGIALVGLFIITAIGTFVVAIFSGLDIKELADPGSWKYDDPRVVWLIRWLQLIQFISLFIFPTFFCAWLFSTDTKEYLGLKRPSRKRYFLLGLLVILVAMPLVNWVGELNQHAKFPSGLENWLREQEEDAEKMIKSLLNQRTVKDLALNLFFIAGLAAVGEELLFRGLLQRLFIKAFRSPWIGIIVTAILFSAMHLQFYGFLPRFLLGVLLGAVYWYSGSLWTAMVAHFLYDATLIVLIYFYPEKINEESATMDLQNMALWALVSLAVAIAVIWQMKRLSSVTYNRVYADDSIPVKNHPF